MLNQVSIIGNLGQDPEVRYTQQGLAIANLNIAVNEFYKDSSGESQKRTHWFRATCFGRTAEIAGQYLSKGSKIGIGGQLVSREWQDQQGNNRRNVEIRVAQLELISGNNTAGNNVQQQPTPAPDDTPPQMDDIPF